MKPPAGKVEGLQCAEDGCAGVLQLWKSQFGFYYGCSQYPKCVGTLPANDDGSPRGEPRKKSLQRARNAAHSAFDVIWKEKHCSRTKAYAWLREAMDLTKDEAHMFQMTEEQCGRVVVVVKEKGPGTVFWKEWYARSVKKEEGKGRASR